MPVPTQDTAHVAEGQGLLTSRYAGLKVTQGITTALMQRMQEIENDLFAFINDIQLSNHPLPGGPWDILDKLGAIVGCPRNGLADADYLAKIKLQARVNRARGRPEDILGLGELMSAPLTAFYLETPPAAFILGTWNVGGSYPIFTPLLAQARPAGVYGYLQYSTWPDGGDIVLGSVRDANAGVLGLGSVYDASAGGKLVASTPI